LGQAAPAAGLTILRRILAYARKVLRWEDRLDAVRDDRQRPQIATSVITRAAAIMFLGRLGSLNALEQTKPSRFWLRWLGQAMPSADSIGRICSLMDGGDVRGVLHHVYARLKRMKALTPPEHGLMLAVVDGHESTASRKRCCPGCCQRVLHTTRGDVLEYYHRYVALRLVGQELSLMLDAEPVHPGEDELAAARRLVERALEMVPRAFDVVAGDALYANTDWFKFLLERGKHALAVLKDNRPNLIEDARSLFDFQPPRTDVDRGSRRRRCWDCDTFTRWPEVSAQVRVVRSLETWTVRRQLDGREEELASDWMWVTTLSARQAATRAVVDMGHERWSIENQGFNELVNRWHANHVFRHHPTAILIFVLLAMLCLNVFMAFYCRNLKPEARRAVTMLHVGKLISAELYAEIRGPPCASA
jgi:hypothetical protein